ncbi:5-carboxymethyl-2-hydroxymuconate Delta-isomerase [Acinetobacter qingfengensis]|uniref:5-carboxymethyl-2-hydroxymuconate Delta-isomerase n=1 Tax=Acinetobacter qingfengensis TaxID=1262585 RepID=A0A1E7R1U1_9GAMM|nr:5-carboxymethyl-2-hydroxymuconate Delta-isomerase [Acinetobacter qingfengensis]OEY93275.1 hypothetical protein BJI46_14295 [Acinetobacter qingfengensis]
MPHIIVEQSANLKNIDAIDLLTELNHALFASGSVAHIDEIKSRLRIDDDFVIGSGNHHQAYIHVKIHLLSGRTFEQKQKISECVMQRLKQYKFFNADQLELQLCVELIEMDREFYIKTKLNLN